MEIKIPLSYSRSQKDKIINYIMTQEEHHKLRSFRNEYLQTLWESEVEDDEKYFFDFYDLLKKCRPSGAVSELNCGIYFVSR